MQATDNFKNVINNHLQVLAGKDELFAEALKKQTKNIDDCVTYILNQVKKSGKCGFADDEIFGMAVHYYEEDDVKTGAKINAKVVVNHHIDGTNLATTKQANKKVAKKAALVQQPSLF